MRRNRDYDATKMTFSLNGGPQTEAITGKKLAELLAMQKTRRPKVGPKTKGQTETAALFTEFVRRGMGR